jgi:hypothetical protein
MEQKISYLRNRKILILNLTQENALHGTENFISQKLGNFNLESDTRKCTAWNRKLHISETGKF